MKVEFLKDQSWSCGGVKTSFCKGDVSDIREDLAALFLKNKVVKKPTKKKTAK